jgi:hypothetical protein
VRTPKVRDPMRAARADKLGTAVLIFFSLYEIRLRLAALLYPSRLLGQSRPIK